MRFIAIFASAVFYCAATAMASQPAKVLLREIARNHTKDSHVALKVGFKTENIKIKKGPHHSDRSLSQLGKTSGGFSRHLQDELVCVEIDDGSLACCAEGTNTGLFYCLHCPSYAEAASDCDYCQISNDYDELCNSCSICPSTEDIVEFSYDCSNLATGTCATKDCDGCTGPVDEPSTGPVDEPSTGPVDEPTRPPWPTSGA